MNCLHCGDCCKRMSPLSIDECPHLIADGGYYFCSIYSNKPEQCTNHNFPFKHCPIGIDVLNITSAHQIAIRIDIGYEKLCEVSK